MEAKPTTWFVRDRYRFLLAVMKVLAGEAHISFEGDLHGFGLYNLPGASSDETSVLKRNTLWPKQDFVVLPLEMIMVLHMFKAMARVHTATYSSRSN